MKNITNDDLSYDIIKYECELPFAEDVLRALSYIRSKEKKDNSSISIFGKSYLIMNLLSLFLSLAKSKDLYFDIEYLQLDLLDINNDYALTLNLEGFDDDIYVGLSIEKAKFDNGNFVNFEGDYNYISNECATDVLMHQIIKGIDYDVFDIVD